MFAPLQLNQGNFNRFAAGGSGGGVVAFVVDDLAALKALVTRPPAVIVKTGQAAGTWQLGTQTTANDGTIVNPTSGTAVSYYRIYDGAIDASWFGSTGAAVIAACAAAQTAGSRAVYVPDGTWDFAATLILPTDYPIMLVGQSRVGTILRATSGVDQLITFTATTAALSTGGQICNMTIDCNLVAYEGIRLSRARDWLLDSLIVYRVLNTLSGSNLGKGIVLGGTSNTLANRLSNISILYEEADYPDPANRPQYGLFMVASNATDNIVTDMIIKNAKDACIYDDCAGGNIYSNIHPYGYPFGDSGLLDYRPNYGIYAAKGFVNISDCYFDTLATAGIYLGGQDNMVAQTRHTSAKAINSCSAIEFVDGILRTTIVGCVSTNMDAGRYRFLGAIGSSVRFTGNDAEDPLRTNTVASLVNWIDILGGATGDYATIRTFGDSSTGIVYQTAGAGTHRFESNGARSLEIYNVASMVNYARVRGSATGTSVVYSAEGTDTDVSLSHVPKGAGTHFFTYGGNDSVEIYGVNSIVNRVRLRGSVASSGVVIGTDGSDLNIDIVIAPKASGVVTTSRPVVSMSGTAIPAGGTAGSGFRFSSTSNFGVFFGSGAPSLSAAKGSLYLRSDGSGATDRAYINTNGSTTWTALTTVG